MLWAWLFAVEILKSHVLSQHGLICVPPTTPHNTLVLGMQSWLSAAEC